MALKPVNMALKPVNIALNVAQTPFRLAQQVVGGVLGGGGSGGKKTSSSKPKDLDDVTIARKVESEVFRDRRIAKGKVDIDVVNGVVSLRGQARTPALVKLAGRRASSVPEVGKVENRLRVPKKPHPRAPTRPRVSERPSAPPRRRAAGKQAPPAPTTDGARPPGRAHAGRARGPR